MKKKKSFTLTAVFVALVVVLNNRKQNIAHIADSVSGIKAEADKKQQLPLIFFRNQIIQARRQRHNHKKSC